MKKAIYILCFMLLGLLVATLVHAVVELPFLWFISVDYETYGGSFWWRHWTELHYYGGLALWLLGLGWGIWGGFHYWRIVYIEKS